MAATHEVLINLTGTLAAAPLQPPSFGGILFLAEDVALDGSNDTLTFTNLVDLQASLDATEINAAAFQAGSEAFSQVPKVNTFIVGSVDVLGGETYSEAFTRLVAAHGDDFYAVCPETVTATDQVALAETVEAEASKIVIIKASASGDGSDILAGATTNYADLSDNERCFGIVHEDATDRPDAAIGYRLSYDLDSQSPTWTGNVAAQTANTGIDTGERTQILDNGFNVLLPFGSSDTYNDPGQSTAGRPMYEIVSYDWFLQNLKNLLISLRSDYDAAGNKIPISPEGQAIVETVIREQHDIGVEADHFFEENDEYPLIQWAEITDADVAAQRLRGTGYIRIAPSARVFQLTFNFVQG